MALLLTLFKKIYSKSLGVLSWLSEFSINITTAFIWHTYNFSFDFDYILFQVAGKGIAKTRKMDVFIVDGDDLVLKKLATIRRNPEVDSFEVLLL